MKDDGRVLFELVVLGLVSTVVFAVPGALLGWAIFEGWSSWLDRSPSPIEAVAAFAVGVALWYGLFALFVDRLHKRQDRRR